MQLVESKTNCSIWTQNENILPIIESTQLQSNNFSRSQLEGVTQLLLGIYEVRQRGAYDHGKVALRGSWNKVMLNLRIVIQPESSVQ